jgi:hypothetical protein
MQQNVGIIPKTAQGFIMGMGINTGIGHTGSANHRHGGFGAVGGGRLMRNPAAQRGARGGTAGTGPAPGQTAGAGQTALKGEMSGVEPTGKGGSPKIYSETRAVTTKGFNAKNMGVYIRDDGSYGMTGGPVCFGINIDGISGRIEMTSADILRIFEESSDYRKAFDTGDGTYDNEILKEMAVSRFVKGDVSGPNGADSNFYVKKDGKLVKVDEAFINKLVGHSYNRYNAADRKAVKDYFDGAKLFTDKAKAIGDSADNIPTGKKYYVYNKKSQNFDEVDRTFIDALKTDGVDVKQFFADKVIYEENPLRKDATREFAKIISAQIEAQFGEEYKNVAMAAGNGEITFRKDGSQISIFGQDGFETTEEAKPAGANAELIDETLERWNNYEEKYYANFTLLKTTLAKLQEQREAWRTADAEGSER